MSKNKRIMVTGHLGYIGSVLTRRLKALRYPVVGYDIKEGKDITKIKVSDFKGVGVVVHLAAIASNPAGEVDKAETYRVNYFGSLRVGKLAKQAGVKTFVFFSGLSIYGNSETTYSKSKFLAESDLMRLSDKNFQVVVLRPGVVFGASPNMRYDTVINQFVVTNEIIVKGDGSTIVPVIHIEDLCDTVIVALSTKSGFYNVK